ncbi:MAG: hypothetical protein ACI4D9_11180 [Lachnospiraceae bacterium]
MREKMREIAVLEKGKKYTYSFEDMLKYHGSGYPGGVAHAFKVMERLFPLLDGGKLPERREIEFVTAFPGPGGRDAFEMVTRCVTENHYYVDKDLPEAANVLESPHGRYYFRLSYRGKTVVATIKPGFVRDEFVKLARKEGRTPEEEKHLAELKLEMADRLMNGDAEDIYNAEVIS